MTDNNNKPRLIARLRKNFFTGLLITAPVAITLYLGWFLVGLVDGMFQALIPDRYQPDILYFIPGLGVIAVGAALIFIGATAKGYMGRLLINTSDKILAKIPVLRSIYRAVKQIIETVMSTKSDAFREVVMIEYPRKGIWSMGFITGTTKGEPQQVTEQETLNVFLPTTPNPTSGYLLFVPRKDAVILNMTVEEGIKMIISGGIVTPPLPQEVQEVHDLREGESHSPSS